MGLCISYFTSSSRFKTTNNRSNGADFSSTTATRSSSVGPQNQFLGAASGGSGEWPNLKVYSLLELKTATMNFKPDSMLGQGGSGEVYRGWIDAETFAPSIAGSGMAVAVKRLNSKSIHEFEDWQLVVNFMGMLSHPNLVKLLGYCREGKEC